MTEIKKILFLLCSIVLFTLKSHALVDLKNANFADAWIDLAVQGTGYDLKVERGYNSRTLFNGRFGFGWCSNFETSLEITPEGNLRYNECGTGLETAFVAQGFSEKDVDKTVRLIVEKVKKDNSSGVPMNYGELEKRLKSETALRAEYAAKYGITRPVADKTKYFANGKETDFIEKQGNNYVRVTAEGSTQKFNLNGKLEKLYDRNGNFITFNYDGKLLKDIADNNGRKLTFYYTENGKIKSITGPDGKKVEYKYKNQSDLVYSKGTTGNVYTYEYDDLHNLTKIIFPDKTYKEMTYNKNKDWIMSFKDVDGCKEDYEYIQSSEDPKNHYWATVQKKCAAKVVLKARYEFWYEMKGDKSGKYLKKSKTQENDIVTEVTYNDLGRPLIVSKGGKPTKFEYYDNGLLRKKTTPDGIVTVLHYDNPFKKVSKVERSGKVSEFFYDSKGNLARAVNSDGQKIMLTYDSHGRIQTLEDQAKRKVAVKYEEKFGKPSMIEREGVGSIYITYNNRGEIQKVTPGLGGATVSTQVASTFYNLLDLIQPSGVTLTF